MEEQNALNKRKERLLNKRLDRVLKYVSKQFEITTKEQLLLYLSIIPNESRKIFEARWGLDGGKYCYKFEALSIKLNMEKQSCLELYQRAETHLSDAKYAILLENDKNAFEFDVLCRYGKLAKDAYPYLLPGMLDVQSLVEIIDTKLNPQQKSVIQMRFGLIDGQSLTFDYIAYKLNYSHTGVMDIKILALKILQKEIRKSIGADNYKDSDSIELLELTVRAYNRLIGAGIYTVGEFKSLSKEQFTNIRGVGEKIINEIILSREELGVPLL